MNIKLYLLVALIKKTYIIIHTFENEAQRICNTLI